MYRDDGDRTTTLSAEALAMDGRQSRDYTGELMIARTEQYVREQAAERELVLREIDLNELARSRGIGSGAGGRRTSTSLSRNENDRGPVSRQSGGGQVGGSLRGGCLSLRNGSLSRQSGSVPKGQGARKSNEFERALRRKERESRDR